MRCAIGVLVLAMACRPDAEGGGGSGGVSAGSAGISPVGGSAGGSGGGGGRSMQGGGAGSGGQSCEQEWSAYEKLVGPARRCDPMAVSPQCDWTVVVFDRCGCSVPANESNPEYLQARRIVAPFSEHCDWPEECDACPSTLDAACKDDGSGTFVCVYR